MFRVKLREMRKSFSKLKMARDTTVVSEVEEIFPASSGYGSNFFCHIAGAHLVVEMLLGDVERDFLCGVFGKVALECLQYRTEGLL